MGKKSIIIVGIIFTVLIFWFVTCRTVQRPPDTIKFSHQLHVGEEVECDNCHGNIAETESLKKSHSPMESNCLECHEEEKESKNCGFCHTDPVKPSTFTMDLSGGVVYFSHKKHVDRAKGECKKCHKKTMESTALSGTEKPMMYETCKSCHLKDFRKISCEKCHPDYSDEPMKPEKYFSHDGNFMKRHGSIAKGNMVACEHCHKQKDCADCHSRNQALKPSLLYSEKLDKKFPHRADFLARHGIEASFNQKKCMTCHKVKDCASCHKDRLVSGFTATKKYHPDGWLNPSSPTFHGPKARHTAMKCASCHEQGPNTNCISCHKIGGMAGNKSPHPPKFKSTMNIKNKPCSYCHR